MSLSHTHIDTDHQTEHLRHLASRLEKLEEVQTNATNATNTPPRRHLLEEVGPAALRVNRNPTALAIGAFATTLTTLSLSLMEWRGVSVTNVFIGDFFFVAGIGMLISAQWEITLGNNYAYTVLSAFGLFYAGFGAIVTPAFGVKESFEGDTVMYNNALGFWVLMWAVWNFFFFLGAIPINLVYAGIFFTVELAFTLVAAAYFVAADGDMATSVALQKAGGAFGFVSGMLGYYTVGNLMCQDVLGWAFQFPMGDTSRFFQRVSKRG